MRFYVIYSFDCSKDESVLPWKPPHPHKWDLTEQSDAMENAEIEGFPKHRKYVSELSKSDFLEFIDHCGLYAERVETMGSLTIFGLLPAISFNGENYYYNTVYQNAYVTPLPEVCNKPDDKPYTECDFARIQRIMWNGFGC